jgi:hypothetical protein
MLQIFILIKLEMRNSLHCSDNVDSEEASEVQWLKRMPMAKSLEAEMILDTKVAKKTRGKEYLEYLVKWKDHPVEESTWMNIAELQKIGCSVEDLMSRSLLSLGSLMQGHQDHKEKNDQQELLLTLENKIFTTRVGS